MTAPKTAARAVEHSSAAAILLTAAVLVGAPPAARAQTYTAEEVRALLSEIVPPLERQHDCAVSLHGEPRFDDFAKAWLVAYSGSGSQCDDMAAALRRAGASLEISFFRRPTAEQLEGVIGKIKRSVAAGYACRLDVQGAPEFDEASGLWRVRYAAAGVDCMDAEEELGRQGREAQLAFLRVPGRR